MSLSSIRWGDWVWMANYRRCCRQAAELQPKFVGPYAVVEVMPNHTYKLECSGQVSVQNETRLKSYWASPNAVGEAPPLLELWRQTTTRGQQQPGPEYEVVVLQAEGLVRDKRLLPLTEVHLPSPTPDLTPLLPEPGTGTEVQNPFPRGRGSIQRNHRRTRRENTSH